MSRAAKDLGIPENDLYYALKLVREFRARVIMGRVDLRATRIALIYANLVDRDAAKKKLYELEQNPLFKGRYEAVHWANNFLAAGEYEHAMELYERAEKETPMEIAVRYNKAYCYLGMGDHQTARRIWDKYGPVERNEYELDMVVCDFMAGNKAAAVERYRKLKADNPAFLHPQNLRYRFMPPRCLELLDHIERLSAQEEAKASAH